MRVMMPTRRPGEYTFAALQVNPRRRCVAALMMGCQDTRDLGVVVGVSLLAQDATDRLAFLSSDTNAANVVCVRATAEK